jgi:hypothetical protein
MWALVVDIAAYEWGSYTLRNQPTDSESVEFLRDVGVRFMSMT